MTGQLDISREDYHARMRSLADLLAGLAGSLASTMALHPAPETYRCELLFFAELFAALSGPAPDYDALRAHYWQRVYAIYDRLPPHVDPRPHHNADKIINHFRPRPAG